MLFERLRTAYDCLPDGACSEHFRTEARAGVMLAGFCQLSVSDGSEMNEY